LMARSCLKLIFDLAIALPGGARKVRVELPKGHQ
jgi:hypothetical protein